VLQWEQSVRLYLESLFGITGEKVSVVDRQLFQMDPLTFPDKT